MVIIKVNLCQPAPPVKNQKILLQRSFTARMDLLTATTTHLGEDAIVLLLSTSSLNYFFILQTPI